MFKNDSEWPEGIQQFWKGIGRYSEIGEGSGFSPKEGRLELHRCFNEQLNEDIVKEKDYIRELVVRKNELDETSYEIISKLSNLNKLVLESVGQNILPLNVENLHNLTDVVIGSASNIELPKWIFSIKSLKRLNISNTRIEELPEDIGYEAFHKLEKLDISYTAIDKLPNFEGRKLDELRELRVAHTSIKDIPTCYFTKTLKFLDCSSTKINGIDNLKEAEELEVFRCSDNNYLEDLSGLPIEGLRVLDISHCQRIRSLPNKNYNSLELMSVCGDSFDSLPINLISTCIEKQLQFRQASVKDIEKIKYENGRLTRISDDLKGIYIEGTFFKQMNSGYLLDNDTKFLKYYIDKEKKEELNPKHETKIMLLSEEKDVRNIFLQKLFYDYSQIYYTEFGGLKVLDTSGGELDYVKRKLNRDANISIWTIDDGINERFMHHILFSDHDFFIVVLKENENTNYYEQAVRWLKEIEQYVRYATIGFVVVGEKEGEPVTISLKEVKQECERKYFRFLNDVLYLNANDTQIYVELTDWLVEGIKEKSDYEMKIIPEWKDLREQIVSYFNLRRVVNKERFESLILSVADEEKGAFINYLTESKSILYIEYSEKEIYYFKTEWVISALFSLLTVFRKGKLKNPFEIDDLRICLQIENTDFLDFFQDSKSLVYLMGILEEIGILYRYSNKYYSLLPVNNMEKSDKAYIQTQDTDLVTYKVLYSILTEQMIPKIIAELIKIWVSNNKNNIESVKIYKGYLVFEVIDDNKFQGHIVIKIITGCPGMLLFYIAESENVSKRKQVRSMEELLKRRTNEFLNELQNLQSFPLWTPKLFVYHRINEINSFISVEELQNYINSGYPSAFMAQYNAYVDVEDIYGKYFR